MGGLPEWESTSRKLDEVIKTSIEALDVGHVVENKQVYNDSYEQKMTVEVEHNIDVK